MAEQESKDRLIVWLRWFLGASVALFSVVAALYLSRDGQTDPAVPPSTSSDAPNGGGDSQTSDPPPFAPPPPPRQKTLEIHRVPSLPDGVEIGGTGDAILGRDEQGVQTIALREAADGKPGDAMVTFYSGNENLLQIPVSASEAAADRKPKEFDWAVKPIRFAVPEMSIRAQGNGHILRLPDQFVLLATRPNGEDFVKLLIDREGFKQTSVMLRPVAGESSPVNIPPMQSLGPPFEESLPEDVFLFVNASRYGQFKDRLNELRGVKLCEQREMQPFVSHFLESSKLSRNRFREETGVDLVDLCAAHTGQIAFAIDHLDLPPPPELPPMEPMPAHLRTTLKRPIEKPLNEVERQKRRRESPEERRLRLEESQRKFQEAQTRQQQERQKWLSQQMKEREETLKKLRAEYYQKVKPSWFFASDVPGSRESVQKMLDRVATTWQADERHLGISNKDVLFAASSVERADQLDAWLDKAPENSLAGNPRLQEFRHEAGGVGDFEVFIDLKRLIDVLVEKRVLSIQNMRFLKDYWGLRRFQSAGFSFSIVQDPFETIWRFMILTKNRPLVFSIFDLPPKPLQAEAWVPGDVTGYYSFSWEQTFLRNWLLVQQFQNEIVPDLGSRITIVSDLTESRGFKVPRFLIAWDLTSIPKPQAAAERIQKILIRYVNETGPIVTSRLDPAGRTIDVWDYGSKLEKENILGEDRPIPVGAVAMTATDTHLMIATHVELLEKVLNHKGQSLPDNPNYQRIAEHFPEECSLIVYQSPAQNQLLFQALKTGQLPGLLQGERSQKIFAGLIEGLDGSKLPDYDKIKHFFQPSGGYGTLSDDGFRYTHFSLKGNTK